MQKTPYLFLVDRKEDLRAPICDPWELVCDEDLLCAMAQNGMELHASLSHYELFVMTYPLFLADTTLSHRVKAKLSAVGIPLPDKADSAWKILCDRLEGYRVTKGRFCFTGKTNAACMTYQKEADLPIGLDATCLTASALHITLPFSFFALPDHPSHQTELLQKKIDKKMLTEHEEKVYLTDRFYRLCSICRQKSIPVILDPCTAVPNTAEAHVHNQILFSALLPNGYTEIAQLYDYLTVRDALPRTLLCAQTEQDVRSAMAIASVFKNVYIGLRHDPYTPLSPLLLQDLPPKRTVLLQDRACPAIFTPIAREQLAFLPFFRDLVYGNLISLLKDKTPR